MSSLLSGFYSLLFLIAILLPLGAAGAWIGFSITSSRARNVFGTQSKERRKVNAKLWLIAAIVLTVISAAAWVLLLLMFGEGAKPL